MRGEQGFKALAQGRIALAFGVEPRGSLRRRFAQRQLKQQFFTVGIHSWM
jgi:hypothetical protein